jgi:8-oxo-(d)GTP phosphatase
MKETVMVQAIPTTNPSPASSRPAGAGRRAGYAVSGFLCLLAILIPGLPRADSGDLWVALSQPGHVALIRHALAPGTGDPSTFRIGDCATQRNLSDAGRKQAQRIGASFRASGMSTARLFSSQWCRCRETAELLGLGPVQELPLLNSFYQRADNRGPQTEGLNAWLAGQTGEGPLVLVTHQVNITALTGVYPASGEIVIVRRSDDGGISVIGTIQTD